MSTRQHKNTVTQYDTLLTQSIVDQNGVWTKQITNPLTEERLQHPLQNDIPIMHIYSAQHYTTLITDNNRCHYYDGLGIAVPQNFNLNLNLLQHSFKAHNAKHVPGVVLTARLCGGTMSPSPL